MSELENTTPIAVAQAPTGGFNFGELMTDETSAKEGVWVDFYGGSRLRIASTGTHRSG